VSQDFEYLEFDDGYDPSGMWEAGFTEPRYFSYDDFNYTERINMFDYTFEYFPTWIGLFGIG